MPKEQKRNGYSDEDLAQIVERMDGAEETRDAAIKAAKDDYKREIKKIEAEAKAVNVLLGPLKVARKVQKLERQIEAATEKVKEDEIEVFTDMLGQMSFLPPEGDESPGEVAARNRRAEIAEVTEQEQAEGAAVLEELGAVH